MLLSNWTDLPPYIEVRQKAWERNIIIWRAVNAGATYTEIAQKLNQSIHRIGQRYRKIDRDIRHNRKCPAVRFIENEDVKTWGSFSDGMKRQIKLHKLLRINNHV